MINAAIYVANKVAGNEEGENEPSMCGSSKDLGRNGSKGSLGGSKSKDSISYIPCILTPVMMAMEEEKQREQKKKPQEEEKKEGEIDAKSDGLPALTDSVKTTPTERKGPEPILNLPVGALSLDDTLPTPGARFQSTAVAKK